MANTRPRHKQLAFEVDHAELIPASRPLTAEEIVQLDDLAERLRRAFFGNRSEEYVDLLRRVSAVRTGKRGAVAPTVSSNPTATKSPPCSAAPAATTARRCYTKRPA